MALNKIKITQLNLSGLEASEIASANSVNLVQDNVAALTSTAAANDYTTYNTLSSLIDTVQDNVASSDNNAWVNANDYSTYTTVTGLIDTVQANLTSVISAAPTTLDTLAEIAAALENDANIAVTLTTSIGTVSDNVDSLTSTTAANDYATYSTLSGLIDTVQDNVSSQSSNTQVYVGDTLVSNTAVILEAGNGVSLSSNADSGIVTFTTAMGNVTSQVISVDGTANSFTMSKAAANSNMLLVFYNGLALDHEEYSVSGTTLTLSNVDPLISSSKLQVRHFDFFDVAGVTSSGGGGGSYSVQGSNYGYSVGGGYIDTVENFPFSSDTNATDVGELSDIRTVAGGHSSSSFGYVSGGRNNSVFVDSIEKFSFSASFSTNDVGELAQSVREHGSSSNQDFGYAAGGLAPGQTDTIQKFPFSSDTSATDIANLVEARYDSSSQNSSVAGYVSGGYDGSPATPFGGRTNGIEKYSFASDVNAIDVGELTAAYHMATGQSSSTHGYNSGGYGTTDTKDILKFSFSSDGSATNIGSLAVFTNQGAGQNSTAYGYITKGSIYKFPFASDSDATSVGSLTGGSVSNSSGHQY